MSPNNPFRSPEWPKPEKPEEVVRLLETADIELKLDDQYFERLHSKIMKEIDEREVETVSSWRALLARQKKALRSHWKGWLATSLSLTTALCVGYQISSVAQLWLSKSHTVQVAQNESEIEKVVLSSPDEYARSVMNYQEQNDFFIEVAAQSLNLSADQN